MQAQCFPRKRITGDAQWRVVAANASPPRAVLDSGARYSPRNPGRRGVSLKENQST